MNLPTSEPLEDDLKPARRRRQSRMVLPDPGDDRARQLDELGLRVTPGAEFFLFALLSGLIFGAALFFDSMALAVLAALAVPFMGPVLGLSIASVAGSTRYFLRSLGSLLTGGLIFFLSATLAGWITRLVPPAGYEQTAARLQLSGPDLFLLTVGVALSTFLLVRSSSQRPMVSGVALAYEIYLPLGAAGFALTSESGLPWTAGLLVFAVHLLLATLVGILTLIILGLRPLRSSAYLLAGGYALAGMGIAFLLTGQAFTLPSFPPIAQAALASPAELPSATPAPARTLSPAPRQPAQATPTQTAPAPTLSATDTPQPVTDPPLLDASATPSATPTHTLVPTSTPTQTVTPQATPVWARINAKDGNGAYIREKPSYDAAVVQPLLNGYMVQVLEDVTDSDHTIWVKVRTDTGKEGWIVRSLLATATPAPAW